MGPGCCSPLHPSEDSNRSAKDREEVEGQELRARFGLFEWVCHRKASASDRLTSPAGPRNFRRTDLPDQTAHRGKREMTTPSAPGIRIHYGGVIAS